MTYVEQTLGPKERYLMRAQFNWTFSIGPWLWAVLGFSPILWASYWHAMNGQPLGDPRWVYGTCLVPAIAGAWLFIRHIFTLITTEIAVTSSRFVYKTGWIARNTKEVSLGNIEEVNVSQSVFGRLFGFGHITIRGTGVGVISLPDLDDPITLRRALEEARAELRALRMAATKSPEETKAEDTAPPTPEKRQEPT